jgi:hypothetical protein
MSATFEPGVFHRFELRSWDMRSFELSIDDTLALAGDLVHVITASKVTWGDGAVGSASLSHWDYYRFGVVPEANSAVGFTMLSLLASSIGVKHFHRKG